MNFFLSWPLGLLLAFAPGGSLRGSYAKHNTKPLFWPRVVLNDEWDALDFIRTQFRELEANYGPLLNGSPL